MHHDKKTDVDIRINIFLFPLVLCFSPVGFDGSHHYPISNHLIYLEHDNKADVDISINIFHVPMYKAYMREYMSKSSILSI